MDYPSQHSRDTLAVLHGQINGKTTSLLATAKHQRNLKKFVEIGKSYRTADEPIDWIWIYNNWLMPNERKKS